jgi:predicted lipoprotein with Yx(FWY)xxD motif
VRPRSNSNHVPYAHVNSAPLSERCAVRRLFRWPAGLGIAVAVVAGMVGIQTHGASASPPSAKTHAAVKLVHNAKLGMIIANSKGMTLYYFTPDKAGKPTCVGACAQYWPPALKSGSTQFGKLSVSGKFGTVASSSGGRQITYNGWPLYRYSGDTKPGQTNGQGIQSVWFVATPKLKRAGSSSSPAPAATATCTPSYYGC